MAFSTYPTVVTGQLWTAANNNQYNRDNINALWPYQAAGDLAYASALDTLARLPIGYNNQFLKTVNGFPSWQYLPATDFYTNSTVYGNSSWDGDTISPGTYEFSSVTTFNSGLQGSYKALLFSLSAKWGLANDDYTVNVAPRYPSDNGNCLVVRAQVGNIFMDASGIVPIYNGFKVIVSGAAASVILKVWGAFITSR